MAAKLLVVQADVHLDQAESVDVKKVPYVQGDELPRSTTGTGFLIHVRMGMILVLY